MSKRRIEREKYEQLRTQTGHTDRLKTQILVLLRHAEIPLSERAGNDPAGVEMFDEYRTLYGLPKCGLDLNELVNGGAGFGVDGLATCFPGIQSYVGDPSPGIERYLIRTCGKLPKDWEQTKVQFKVSGGGGISDVSEALCALLDEGRIGVELCKSPKDGFVHVLFRQRKPQSIVADRDDRDAMAIVDLSLSALIRRFIEAVGTYRLFVGCRTFQPLKPGERLAHGAGIENLNLIDSRDGTTIAIVDGPRQWRAAQSEAVRIGRELANRLGRDNPSIIDLLKIIDAMANADEGNHRSGIGSADMPCSSDDVIAELFPGLKIELERAVLPVVDSVYPQVPKGSGGRGKPKGKRGRTKPLPRTQRGLTPRQRRALTLFGQKQSYTDVAKEMGISRQAATTMVKVADEKIKNATGGNPATPQP